MWRISNSTSVADRDANVNNRRWIWPDKPLFYYPVNPDEEDRAYVAHRLSQGVAVRRFETRSCRCSCAPCARGAAAVVSVLSFRAPSSSNWSNSKMAMICRTLRMGCSCLSYVSVVRNLPCPTACLPEPREQNRLFTFFQWIILVIISVNFRTALSWAWHFSLAETLSNNNYPKDLGINLLAPNYCLELKNLGWIKKEFLRL